MDMALATIVVNGVFAPKSGSMLYVFIAASLLIGVIIFLLMRAVPGKYRKPIVMGVTFVAGLFYSVEFFWRGSGPGGANLLSGWLVPVGEAVAVIGSFTLLLGITNLFMIHGKAVRRLRSGWYNSAAFFIAFATILIVSIVPFIQRQVYGGSGSGTLASAYDILFYGALASLNATMFSLVAFYIVSASYRAFRIRSGEATLMMVSAFIVMLGMVPIGIWMTNWLPQPLSVLRLENVTQWILSGPNMAAQRGIAFGIAVGALAMALRIWLSLERGSYFDKQG